MTFEERNDVWDGKSVRRFSQTAKTGKTKEWLIVCGGTSITTSWGLLGGAVQTVTETVGGVNLGKANEVSAEDNAVAVAANLCKKKHWEGYAEINPVTRELLDPPVTNTVDLTKSPLPLNFRGYKPLNEITPAIDKCIAEGRAWYTRKRNGLSYMIVKDMLGVVTIYSRTMLTGFEGEPGSKWVDRFPQIAASVDSSFPPGSILCGDIVMPRNGHEGEDFSFIQSLSKSMTAKAIEDQQAKGFPSFYIWDILFYGGKDLMNDTSSNYSTRYQLILNSITPASKLWLMPAEIYTSKEFPNKRMASKFAEDHGYEGWVVVDPTAVYGSKGYTFNGKPERPGHACCKLKPIFEDDFIVYWDPTRGVGEASTKQRYAENGVAGIKSVALYQMNMKGEQVYIANLSSGLTEEQKIKWANPALFPQVWKVSYLARKYISQGDKTNAVDHASFIEVRSDKSCAECTNEKL